MECDLHILGVNQYPRSAGLRGRKSKWVGSETLGATTTHAYRPAYMR